MKFLKRNMLTREMSLAELGMETLSVFRTIIVMSSIGDDCRSVNEMMNATRMNASSSLTINQMRLASRGRGATATGGELSLLGWVISGMPGVGSGPCVEIGPWPAGLAVARLREPGEEAREGNAVTREFPMVNRL